MSSPNPAEEEDGGDVDMNWPQVAEMLAEETDDDNAEADGVEGEADDAEAEDEDGAEDEDDNVDVEEDAEPEEETAEGMEEKNMPRVLAYWEGNHTVPGFDPVPVLKRLAVIFESEHENYMRKDPDPFDERHPYRTDPSCQFGFLLKQLFRKDHFMNKLVNDYLRDNFFTRQNIQKSSLELNIVASRLILVIMPGLETAAVFQPESDQLINRIYTWAEDSIEPLQSYATGLLASAMEVTDIAVSFRELNTRLVPKMLKRLHMLQAIYKSKGAEVISIASNTPPIVRTTDVSATVPGWTDGYVPASPARSCSSLDNSRDTLAFQQRTNRRMYIPIHPPTTESSQMLILRYLTSMGEYQEFLGQVFEHRAMQLIFGYIENLDVRDTCLAFEALKYLASLLCHKKFALEFIQHGGLDLLIKVPRPSIAATGVSIALYYLAYCEDAMERICAMPKRIISDLVRYALWLLGRSYDSGKCHATMFFGLSFQFKVILNEFDYQDGLRKLYNVISILPILNPSTEEDASRPLNDDMECAARQLVRHVCVAMKKYMESHLFYKYTHFIRSQQNRDELATSMEPFKTNKVTLEQISEQIQTLQENSPARSHWAPVDQLLKLGGITLLQKIIALSYEWNNSGRAETVRSALDVLSISTVVPRVFLAFCERLDLPDNNSWAGINAILGAAISEIVKDPDVQKSALAVLVHCVCAPFPKVSKVNQFGSSKKKSISRYSEELIEKVWECVCSNNGIIVLLQLVQIKVPVTDADCIRGMAVRALAGLARSERVRQIIGKLPLFAGGQFLHLMRDPILQEKRAEHVIFQKYALELLERVSGKSKPVNNQLDASLANMHKANVVAQTKINFNENQLYQLIHDHLEMKGLTGTAQMLQKEAGLATSAPVTKSFHQSPFDYKILPTNSINRSRMRARAQEINTAINSLTSETNGLDSPTGVVQPIITPIKLIKKMPPCPATASTSNGLASSYSTTSAQRSLQKQISSTDGYMPSPSLIQRSHTDVPNNSVSLETIVTEYLTSQHALCNNPVSTCPQFDLFKPHKCPDPKPTRIFGADRNLTTRFIRGQSGYDTMRLNNRFVHENFSPWRTIRSIEYNELQFTCCAFLPSNIIVAGSYHGEAKAFNRTDGSELFSYDCHHNACVENITANRQGDLVITSTSWRSPTSGLWSISNNEFQNKLLFVDEFYCEFSNMQQDKILGTKNDACVLYDIHTGQPVSTYQPSISNHYTKNRATFCPTDELILSDGVLWDVRAHKEIHKFDKLNQTLSGVFHPSGLEIISNTDVWDLRTFHLLQTVPVLDQCWIKFSPRDVLYAFSVDSDSRMDFDNIGGYDSSYKVLDSYDYSSISTMDVKKHIYDISVDKTGSYIALVESMSEYDSSQETFIKIYAVGMRKNEEEHEEEEEDEEMESEESNSTSGSIPLFNINTGHRLRRRHNLNDDDGWIDIPNSSDSDLDDDDDDDDDDDEDGEDDDNSSDNADLMDF